MSEENVMTEIERIRDQMARAFRGEAWHGSSFLEVLDGVTAGRAAAKPHASAHSIWEIVLHVTASYDEIVARLHGKRVVLTPEDDWPAVEDTGESAWLNAKEKLEASHDKLLAAIVSIDDTKLDSQILEGFSSYYATFHGTAQHDAYHAGQIALLKK